MAKKHDKDDGIDLNGVNETDVRTDIPDVGNLTIDDLDYHDQIHAHVEYHEPEKLEKHRRFSVFFEQAGKGPL